MYFELFLIIEDLIHDGFWNWRHFSELMKLTRLTWNGFELHICIKSSVSPPMTCSTWMYLVINYQWVIVKKGILTTWLFWCCFSNNLFHWRPIFDSLQARFILGITSSISLPGKKVCVIKPAFIISVAVRCLPVRIISWTAPPKPEVNCGNVTLAAPSGIWPSLPRKQ